MKKLNKLAAMAALGLVAGAAQGQNTTTAQFNVTANVAASCAATATDMGFGAYSPFAAGPTDGSTTINVTCTNGHPYSLSVDTAAARAMTRVGGGATLNYGLYSDDQRALPFAVSSVGTGASQPHNVFGRIPAAQISARPGDYADTVVVTVTY